jgi:ribonuclease E
LAGSIADELGPATASEAGGAVADMDAPQSQRYEPPPEIEAPRESVTAYAAPQPDPVSEQPRVNEPPRAEPARPEPAHDETAREAEKARRRSTVREKVSFGVESRPEASPPAAEQPQSAAAAPADEPEPASQTSPAPAADTQPRRAGWWSRRFGGGE